MMPDDAALLRRFAETGAEDAFEEIVRRHLDAVYSAALRRVGGDVHLAQDVAQLVFVALARKAGEVARRPVLTSWLHTATRNEAANVVRTERRRKVREQEAQSMHELTGPPEPEIDWPRLAPILDDAIDALGETDRAAVLLRFVERRAFAEIGVALRVSEDAARMRVDRALEKLRAGLGRRGVSSTAAALAATLATNAVIAAPTALAAAVTGPAVAAGALAAAGPGWFTLFMTSKYAVSAGGLALLLATGVATFQINAQKTAVSVHAAQLAATAKLADSLGELRQRETSAARALEATRTELAQVEAQRPTPPSSASATAPDPVEAGKAFLARHSEAETWWLELRRANLTRSLLPRYVALGITPAEQERLEVLALRAMTGRTTLNGPGGEITLQRPRTLSDDEMLAETRALLGDERFQCFMDLRACERGFELAGELATSLAGADALTLAQTVQMVKTFEEAMQRAGAGPTASLPLEWDSIRSRALAVLTPAQLTALEQVRRRLESERISRSGAADDGGRR